MICSGPMNLKKAVLSNGNYWSCIPKEILFQGKIRFEAIDRIDKTDDSVFLGFGDRVKVLGYEIPEWIGTHIQQSK